MKKYLGLFFLLLVLSFCHQAVADEATLPKPINSSFVGDDSNRVINDSFIGEDVKKKTGASF